MIAVLSAMAGEIEATVRALGNPIDESFAGRLIMRGRIGGVEIIAGRTGVGKSLAAMTVQGVIDRNRPTALVFAGIAGALNQSYDIGDVVIARDCIQHDFDATRFGFRPGEIPNEHVIELACDSKLFQHALRWEPAGRAVRAGRILSGDRFVSLGVGSPDQFLVNELGGDAVDMESAAAALIAHLNGIPFLLMRIISDKADGVLPRRFRRFLKESSRLILEFARYIVSLPAAPG